jgi:hypothetical protein
MEDVLSKNLILIDGSASSELNKLGFQHKVGFIQKAIIDYQNSMKIKLSL